MDDLIKALEIFDNYTDSEDIFQCEHDVLYVNINAADVSTQDIDRLEELGFTIDEDDLGIFMSFKYGSC